MFPQWAVLGLMIVAILRSLPASAELPVRQVVLYKHGVGYIERSGKLAAGEAARLDFKVSEMNDVLKSLTVTEKGGGTVRALRYDASEPFAQKLGEFPFRIGERQSITALFDQLKGARLEMALAGEAVSGSILGARTISATQGNAERDQVSLLTDAGDMRTLDLAAASRVRFSDPALQQQLNEYLQALLKSRSTDKRVVYIDSTDARVREISVGYVVPTPIWKSSYRLMFQESGQALLEGWAIVDNTSGEDWSNVGLSLVSGRPVSFISPLYEPRYLTRPIAQLAEERAVSPTVFGGAAVRGQTAPAAKPAPARPAAAPASLMERMPVEQSSIQSVAEARELGELFEYRIAGTVTVRKNESAMLPFVQQRIAAKKLSVYADPGATHPMHAAELSNATGKTLDGGPITIYDGGAYGGEALMETLKSGDRRLIGYGVDLGTRVSTHFESGTEVVREIRINRGVMTSRMAIQETRTYTVRNIDRAAKTLVIEHTARPGYTVVSRAPDEQTASAYRFELKLAADSTQKFAVIEERVFSTATSVTNLSTDAIIGIAGNKALGDAARQQLQQVIQAKQGIADLEAQMRGADRQIQDLNADQDRIRKNIASLNMVAGQQETVQKYARQLAGQESQLSALRDSRAEFDKQLNAARQQLDKLVASLTF